MKKIIKILILGWFWLTAPLLSLAESADMVLIPKGCFQMGTEKLYIGIDEERNDTERPVHKVCLDAFYLDKYEASQKLYKKIMGHNPSTLIKDEWPVEHVKFEQARLFCAKQKKRLPTEAEWEYAARAGSREDAPWGDALDSDYVWYAANSMRSPHPVNSKKPNPYGVHNMLGSVWEWVSDWYSPTYYQKSPVKNPKGPLKRKSHHVIRGGSWLDDETQLRVGLRRQGLADATDYYLVGVRCARSLKSGK